ncbi:hypothetical protein C7999DRAFT_10775 [Corynascus novoguineensis]|uniref:Uncharacterized protein n=1 Tax=Corynascus novoguineensis TaxID=1126955 RepID=A0AAN7D0G7_9PEZI|nr:hypothetical protein C7999DRAFT_10775 [Corynascus novoguineensis]
MGLFSFLSKKTSTKGKVGAPLRGQPYLSASSGFSNTKADESAVAGNDTNAENSIFRGRAGFNQSQLSLDAASEDEEQAPTPNVARYRDGSTERVGTAPNGRPSSVVLTKGGFRVKGDGQRRMPPLSFRMTGSENAGPGSRPGSRGSASTIKDPFRRNPGHSRTGSLRTNNAKAFKDLLDAQSEIKPADFRERVTAAGARDYGEDVAERNLGENGFDLGSKHVKAFYAQPRRAESQSTGHLAGTKKLDPYKAGVRRLSPHASQPSLFRETTYGNSLTSNSRHSRKTIAARRSSVATYMPLGLGKMKSLPLDRKPEDLGQLPPRTPAPEIQRLDFGLSALGSSTPVVPQVPEDTAPAPTIRTTRRPRDSVELAKRKVETPLSEDEVADDAPASSFAVWSASRSRRSSAILSATSPPRRHHSFYTLQSSASSTVSRETLHVTPLSPPEKTSQTHPTRVDTENLSQETSVLSEHGDALTATASPASRTQQIVDNHVMPSSPGFASITSKEGLQAADIILQDDEVLDFPPPIPTSSTRKWSASSGTPTACESSTAPSIVTSTFNRPPSLHTADTSVDLSIRTNSPPLKPMHPYSATHDSDSDIESHYDGNSEGKEDLTPLETEATGPADTLTDTFNIDDYVSSDAESLMIRVSTSTTATTTTTNTNPNRRPTAEGEEELLFKDYLGFGPGGMQLPGLADLFPSSTSPKSLLPSPPGGRGHAGDEGQEDSGLDDEKGDEKHRNGNVTVLAPYGTHDPVHDMRRWEEGYSAKNIWKHGGESEQGRARRSSVLGLVAADGDMRRKGATTDDADDDGYEADYVDDDDDNEERLSSRQMSLRRLEGHGEECAKHHHQHREEEQSEQPRQQQSEMPRSKVAIAVRLRKQARRARMLAGEPSPAMLRRKGPTNQGLGKRLSVPVLRTGDAE